MFLLSAWLNNVALAYYYTPIIAAEPKYKTWQYVSQGSFGVVYKKADKVIKISLLDDVINDPVNILEIALLQALKHKAIPKVTSVNFHLGLNGDYFEIELPYYAKSNKENLYEIMKDMASVLTYAHELNIAHGDIKSQHILAQNGGAVLIDWGSAEIFTADPEHRISTTLNYRDPAMLMYKFGYPKANDLWSLGISLLEISIGQSPMLVSHDEYGILEKILLKVPNGGYNHVMETLLISHRNGQQVFSTELINAVAAPGLVHKNALMDLLDLNPETRLTARQLSEELEYNQRITKLPEPPKTLVFKEGTINNNIRRITYSWLNTINSNYFRFPEKVFFEAMSIADRIIKRSTMKKEHFKIAALIAYYLAAQFHYKDVPMSRLVAILKDEFTLNQFEDFMLQILRKTHYNLIFNHTLRDFQNELYIEMSRESRDLAIAVLKMLEIDEKTFAFSNQKKWAITQEVINNTLSDNNKIVLGNLCLSFKYDNLAKTKEYTVICNPK